MRTHLDRLVPHVPLEAEGIVVDATRRAGIVDHAPTEVPEGLRRLLRSAEEDAELDRIGRVLLRRALVGSLANRLRFLAWRATHPVAEQPRRPVIVAGLPRTGSTLLQQLLSAHPEALSLPLWLAIRPFPPPAPAVWARGGEGAPLREATLTSWAVRTLAPDQMARHPVLPRGRVECSHLQMGGFESMQWWGLAPLHGYADWLRSRGLEAAYAELADQLSLLQTDLPGSHWVLKSPSHFLRLDTALDAFPGARVVLLHRDPVAVVASTAALLRAGHAITSPHRHVERQARLSFEALAEGAERVTELRPGLSEERVLDVHFTELLADPVATVRRIHAWAGIDHGEAVEDAVQAELGRHPRHRFGRTTYSAGEVGLDPDEIRHRFTRYSEHFGLETTC